MFEFDASKLLIIAIVALVVIGPKDLPRVLRQVGQAVGKMRRMAAEFQGQFMEAMKEAELADARAEVEKLAAKAKIDAPFDPLADIRNELRSTIEKADEPALAPPPAREVAEASLGVLGEAPPAAPEGAEPPAASCESAPEGEVRAGGDVKAEMAALAVALKQEIDTPEPEPADAPRAGAGGA
ncbi:Sec-independent protein translocase protein TatB [Methylocella sp.]|uniref:Sec-independent protein translocase protein TatB n=1 Tax=Methylocella sp. TaxID=1978226 RepID=UPI003784817B